MKTEDLKAKGLSDEQINFVMEENGKDIKTLQDENATLKSEKSQLENDKKVLEKEKGDKEKALADLQKSTITKEEYDNKIKEIEGNAKKEHEEYVLNQLLDQAMEDAKVLKNENARASIKGLLDMEKVTISKDQKSLIGVKEQLEAMKKTDSYFFESTVKGHSPAGGKDDKDGEGEGEDNFDNSNPTNVAKELNSRNEQQKESSFFN